VEAEIKRVWRCSCGGRNRASLEIHLEAVIQRVWRYALGGHDPGNLEICTWRPGSCELAGHNRVS
jgi:hypothetical protein